MSEDIADPTPKSSTPAQTAEERAAAISRGWIVPAVIGSALMMQTLNATVLSNALPVMAQDMGEDPLRLNLAISMYLLAAAVFLPISGWAADMFGAKRIFLLAMVLYAVSSALCGLADTLLELVGGRLLQGAAGAMMAPVGRLVLLRTTPKNELVGAMSVLTMPALLGPVLGPPVGGFIVTFWDWPWIFFMNLPIAAAGVLLVLRFVPIVPLQDPQRLDWKGMLLTGIGLASVIFGFETLGRDVLPGVAVAGLFAAGGAMLWTYAWHARRTPYAILDLSLFRVQTFQASVVGGAFMRIAMGATPFMLALLLQVAFGLTALAAGLLTFIGAAGALVMKTTAPPILRRFGFRNVLVVNALITGVFFLAYGFFQIDTPHWLIMLVLLAGGFFRSLQFTSLNGLAYADIGQDRMSRASTMSAMAQQLVQSVGIGLAATLIHQFTQMAGATEMTTEAISRAFLVIGALTFVSLVFYLRLPKDAGDEMNRRGPASGAASGGA
ncbi:MAG: MFS transporter [Phenylobacterium sp.]|uniref:MFS transporter n=1 Tax=Phenylobacterium sp. TaxID=1871053 RepID=UPI00260159B4|nr:MFS transporter [Phenylobacterium sp.]MCG9916002.1 MFS transporter [Phenylobacterium sp.]